MVWGKFKLVTSRHVWHYFQIVYYEIINFVSGSLMLTMSISYFFLFSKKELATVNKLFSVKFNIHSPFLFKSFSNTTGITRYVYLEVVAIFVADTNLGKFRKIKVSFGRFRIDKLRLEPARCEFMRKEDLLIENGVKWDRKDPNDEKS